MTTRMKILVSAFVVIYLILNSVLISQNFWQQTNGPYGGRAASFSHNQITHNFYCFCSGQIYKCLPDSNKWEKINTPFISITCFSVSPSGVFFCATFDDKLYRSSNEGISWEHVGLEIPVLAAGSCFVFTDIDEILLGTDVYGIYKSTNAGYNWFHVLNDYVGVRCMVINNNDDIYAGTLWEGLYKSTNNGYNWNLIAFSDSSIYGLTTNSNGYIFAAGDGSIHRSTNNGVSWDLMVSGVISQRFALFTDGDNNIYAGTEYQGILQSTNEGVTWFFKNEGLLNKDVLSFGERDNIVYCGTNFGKGIYKFDNSNDCWLIYNTGVTGSHVNSVAVHPSGRIFSYVNNDGIFYSDDNGLNWIETEVNDTLSDSYNSNFAITGNGEIYALSDALYKSTNNGLSWLIISSSPDIYYGALYASPYGVLFVSNSSGLFRSTNSGLNWVRINGFSYLDAFNVNSEGILFASWNEQIYISTNNGNNWIARGLSGQFVSYITFDKYSNIYAGTCDQGIFKSTNNGLYWQSIGLGGRDVMVISINNHDEIIAYTEYGLFASTNGGTNWFAFQSGMFTGAFSLAVDSSGYFYAGTYEGGVFKTFSPLISVKHQGNVIPQKYYLCQNFPNPFNPVTTIKYEIPVLSNVNISVYDALGKKVKELVNERLTAGIYEVRWNAENFSSGVYFYSLQTEGFTQTKKMILLK